MPLVDSITMHWGNTYNKEHKYIPLSWIRFNDFGLVWFGALRRINPCGSLASDSIKLNMKRMEKVTIYKTK